MAHAFLFPENLWKHVFVKTSLSQCLLEQITLFYSVNINKASNILLFFPTSICFKSKVVKWFTRGPLFPVFYLQTIEAKILQRWDYNCLPSLFWNTWKLHCVCAIYILYETMFNSTYPHTIFSSLHTKLPKNRNCPLGI